MDNFRFLDPIRILHGPKSEVVTSAVLLLNNKIHAFDKDARKMAKDLNIKPTSSGNLLFAPCLVDPHSFLEEPLNGRSETLISLIHKAISAGYGQIALLPRSNLWRDKPEHLLALPNSPKDVFIHLWGGFSQGGKGKELSPHKDLIDYGAIGLADDDSIIPIELLKKGLLLNELQGKPILLAPRCKVIQDNGMARESIEALRSGWQQDPIESETIPLATILELQKQHQNTNIRLMNLSTATGISILEKCSIKPMASVCWWHLVADQSSIGSTDIGMYVSPSLGNSNDRQKLKDALKNKVLTGVSVHSIALDDTETKKPFSDRIPGLSGHHLVLPSLWQELIEKSNWSIEELWEATSFGPSQILKLPPEELHVGSNRWLIFDPTKKWVQTNKYQYNNHPSPANQPWEGIEITGKVVSCGLNF